MSTPFVVTRDASCGFLLPIAPAIASSERSGPSNIPLRVQGNTVVPLFVELSGFVPSFTRAALDLAPNRRATGPQRRGP
jgi:hypothetical protein